MKLLYLNGELAGKEKELTPPKVRIGRETDNDIQILLGGLSRYHAKLEFADGVWKLTDLGSTNGTSVNQVKVTDPVALKNGDMIQMGEQQFKVMPDASETAASEEPVIAIKPPAPVAASQAESGTDTIPNVIFHPIEPEKSADTEIKLTPEPEKVKFNFPAEPEKKDEDSSKADKTMEVPKVQFTDNIFARQQKDSEESGDTKRRSFFGGGSRMMNLIFYLVVISAAAICIAVFIKMNTPQKKVEVLENNPARTEDRSFLLSYEKQIVEKDNIFRFALQIENGEASITLDDLKHSRHYASNLGEVKEKDLTDLLKAVKATDFMKLQQESVSNVSDGTNETRTIILGYGNNLNKITVQKTASLSFEKVEKAITDFMDDVYSIQTVSLLPREMEEEADKAFKKAEALFSTFEARPENLREAILRYRMAMDLLEQFEPKPEQWTVSRQKLAEAQEIMRKRIKDAEFSVRLYVKRKEYQAAVAECSKLMAMVDPDSESFKKIRAYKIKLEKGIEERKK